MTHTPKTALHPPLEVYHAGVEIGDRCGHVATAENEDIARIIVARLTAFEAMREACRLLVDSYVAEVGTYALGELSQAREKARAALKLTEARS